ncbi:MAG: hypothetical protein KAW45_08445 [Thermoplasmatales archaeon]|nr:hypothetical protein [Thermoplasmatales archaeon]
MKGRNFQGILFIIWLIIATLSAIWILFSIILDVNLILTETVYQFVLLISCLSLIIATISIHEMLTNAKNKIIDQKIKEKNVRDVYRYQQLLDPPDADMNN